MKKYKVKVKRKVKISPNQPDILGLKNLDPNSIDDRELYIKSDRDRKTF